MPEFTLTDLDKLREERVKVDNCIRDLQRGIASAQQKYAQYLKLVDDPTIPGTDGLTYDIEMLQTSLVEIRQNMRHSESVLNKEVRKLSKLDTLILEGEKFLGNFGDCTGTGQTHDWKITEMFDVARLAHQWKRRECRKCGAVQKLGHD